MVDFRTVAIANADDKMATLFKDLHIILVFSSYIFALHRHHCIGLFFHEPHLISATPCPPPLPPRYSQAVFVDVEGGGQRPLARHAAHVAARPEFVALLESEGGVDEGRQVHEVDAAEGLVRVRDLKGKAARSFLVREMPRGVA